MQSNYVTISLLVTSTANTSASDIDYLSQDWWREPNDIFQIAEADGAAFDPANRGFYSRQLDTPMPGFVEKYITGSPMVTYSRPAEPVLASSKDGNDVYRVSITAYCLKEGTTSLTVKLNQLLNSIRYQSSEGEIWRLVPKSQPDTEVEFE